MVQKSNSQVVGVKKVRAVDFVNPFTHRDFSPSNSSILVF